MDEPKAIEILQQYLDAKVYFDQGDFNEALRLAITDMKLILAEDTILFKKAAQ